MKDNRIKKIRTHKVKPKPKGKALAAENIRRLTEERQKAQLKGSVKESLFAALSALQRP
jgi:hypothetical protein